MKKLLFVLILAGWTSLANAQTPTPFESATPAEPFAFQDASPSVPAPAAAPVIAASPQPLAPSPIPPTHTPAPGSFETKIEILGHDLARLDDAHGKTHPPRTDREDTVVPVAFFLTVIGIVAAGYYSRYRQKVLLHQTVRAMVEKGMEIPPALLDPQGRTKAPRSDLRRGIVLIGVGIGLSVFLALVHTSAWGLGLIPLCIGIGYVIVWKLETKDIVQR